MFWLMIDSAFGLSLSWETRNFMHNLISQLHTGVSMAAGAAANSEEIDLDGIEEDFEDSGDNDRVEKSREHVIGSAEAEAEAEREESMFAPVEIHNFDPAAAADSGREGEAAAVPEALVNALRHQ